MFNQFPSFWPFLKISVGGPLGGGWGEYTGPRVYAWHLPSGVHGGGRRYALPSAPCSLCVEEWPLPDSWCLRLLNSGFGRRMGLMHEVAPHPNASLGRCPALAGRLVGVYLAGGARAAYTRHRGIPMARLHWRTAGCGAVADPRQSVNCERDVAFTLSRAPVCD